MPPEVKAADTGAGVVVPRVELASARAAPVSQGHFSSWHLTPVQLPNAASGKTADAGPWKAQMEPLLRPGPPQPLWPFGKWVEDLSVSLPFKYINE